jgi:hypothetical protein
VADIDVFGRDPDASPRCRTCSADLVPCPRGEACVGTSPWRVLVVCECLRGSICPQHGSHWAPSR